jgi:AcrR family transcriptional regulator
MNIQRGSRKEQAERRREQLLETALELFVERGIENVSIADLAVHAGVAHGLIYHYFTSKDELVAAVVRHASPSTDVHEIVEQMRGLPVTDGLRILATRFCAILEARGDVVRFLLRESLSPRSELPAGLMLMQEELLVVLSAYLDEQIEAGTLRPHDPRTPFRMLISSILLLGVLKQPIEPWIESFVDTILNGIRAEELS